MGIDAADLGLDGCAVIVETLQSQAVVGFVRGGDGHAGEAAAVHLGPQKGDDGVLRALVEVTAFLFSVVVPEVGDGLIEGLDGGESEIPVILGVLGYSS